MPYTTGEERGGRVLTGTH